MPRFVIKSPALPGGEYVTNDVPYPPSFRQAVRVIARESGGDPVELAEALKARQGVRQSSLLSVEPTDPLFDPSEPVEPGKRGIPAGAALVPVGDTGELTARREGAEAAEAAIAKQKELATRFGAGATIGGVGGAIGGAAVLAASVPGLVAEAIEAGPILTGRKLIKWLDGDDAPDDPSAKGEGRSFAEAVMEPIILTKEEQEAPFTKGFEAGETGGAAVAEAIVRDPIKLAVQPSKFFSEEPVAAGLTALIVAAPLLGAAARGLSRVPSVQSAFRSRRLKKVMEAASPEARAELAATLKASKDARKSVKAKAEEVSATDRAAEASAREGFALNETELVAKRRVLEEDFGSALGPMKEKVPVPDRALVDEAVSRGINKPEAALALVAQRAKDGAILTAADEVGVNAAIGALQRRYDRLLGEAENLKAAGNSADGAATYAMAEQAALDMDRLLAASVGSGSEIGRAMRARRLILRDDMSIAGLRRKMSAVSDRPITPKMAKAMQAASKEGAAAREGLEESYAAFAEIDKRMVKAAHADDVTMQDLLDQPWTKAADEYARATTKLKEAQRKANAVVESAKPIVRQVADFALSALVERSLRASVDFSAMSTQGALSLFSHPMHGFMSTAESLMMISPKHAARLVLDPRTKRLPYFSRVRYGGMYRDQWAKTRVDAGLRLYEMPGVPSVLGMAERELEYATSAFNHMLRVGGAPGFLARTVLAGAVHPSERMYAGFLGGLRMRMMDEYAKLVLGKAFFTSKGKLTKDQLIAMRPVANFVNAATGYGRLPFGLTGKLSADVGGTTVGLLWSPRQLGATLEMSTGAPFWEAVWNLGKGAGSGRLNTRTMMALGGGMAQQAAVGMGVLAGLKVAGYDVNLSMRQSPGTWGKAIDPDTGTMIDPWSGRQQIVRAIMAGINGGVFTSDGDFKQFGVAFGSSWADFLGSTIDAKLAPGLVRIMVDAIRDKKFGGEVGEFELMNAVGETWLPISIQNGIQLAASDGDVDLAAKLGAVGILRANNYSLEQDANADDEGGFNPITWARGEEPGEGPMIRAWDSIDDIFHTGTEAFKKAIE